MYLAVAVLFAVSTVVDCFEVIILLTLLLLVLLFTPSERFAAEVVTRNILISIAPFTPGDTVTVAPYPFSKWQC